MTLPPQQLYIGSRPSGELIVLDLQERRRHLYVVGQTGTGKSTLLLNLIRQDLVAREGLALLDHNREALGSHAGVDVLRACSEFSRAQ